MRRWITYEEIVNSNYLDALDLIVESERITGLVRPALLYCLLGPMLL